MVVDLAVEDDPHAPVLVAHRLGAAFDVDNREPAKSEPDMPVDPQSLSVGPPVAQHVPHQLEPRLVDGLERIQADDADDSAHGARSLSMASDGKTPSMNSRAVAKQAP